MLKRLTVRDHYETVAVKLSSDKVTELLAGGKLHIKLLSFQV
jgi:hypothetical protein